MSWDHAANLRLICCSVVPLLFLRSFVFDKFGVQANIGEKYAHLRHTEEDLGSEVVFRMDGEWSIEFIMESCEESVPGYSANDTGSTDFAVCQFLVPGVRDFLRAPSWSYGNALAAELMMGFLLVFTLLRTAGNSDFV